MAPACTTPTPGQMGDNVVSKKATPENHTLSINDETVLTQLFDPESSAAPPSLIIDASLPSFPQLASVSYATQTQLKSLEVLAIRAAEAGDNTKAISLLTQATEICSVYASAYNNRAQVWRMSVLFKARENTMDNLFSTYSGMNDMVLKAFRDLTRAISLAAPRGPTEAISPQQAKMLANAYTQRASILHTSAKFLTSRDRTVSIPEELRYLGDDVTMWEGAASKDFFHGGRYGNELAKGMAVHTNPYAKLCGNIVKEAMKKEIGEAY